MNQFHPWSILIQEPEDSTISPEKSIEFEDIYIPVPYDPNIPGVRCIDAERGLAKVNVTTDIPDHEAIELQEQKFKKKLKF